jgi:ABC-type multidrug transport system fused ATPase/permease subunit
MLRPSKNFSFLELRDSLAEKKEKDKKIPTPLTREKQTDEESPMELRDFNLTFRANIQEKLSGDKDGIEPAEILNLKQIISPELLRGYKEILKSLKSKSAINEKHPTREYLDIEAEEINGKIGVWTNGLIEEVENSGGQILTKEEKDELSAQCNLLFQAFARVINCQSINNEVKEFYKKEEMAELEPEEQEIKKKELIKKLAVDFPFSKEELSILIDAAVGKGEEYNYKILFQTLKQVWDDYKLGERKKDFAKISFGFLAGRAAGSYAPSLFSGIMAGNNFNFAVFAEYFGLQKLQEFIDSGTQIKLQELINEINKELNRKITDSLFYQEFEFIHEQSLGDIYSALENGKLAVQQLIGDMTDKFTPIIAGNLMSLVFLTKINPILGSIGFASLPVMGYMAKKQNEKMWPKHNKERREGAKIANQLSAVKSGFEEIKTTPDVPEVSRQVTENMNIRDYLRLDMAKERIKMDIKNNLPFDIASLVATGVGEVLNRLGMISGGAVLSTLIYSERMNRPMRELISLYYGRFPQYVQDINKMNEIFGNYNEADNPEGEKEKQRIPVTVLDNFKIEIRNLCYKKILKGVDLDINEGEFVALVGLSGGGKSTLLRNIVGLYQPDEGEVKIGGAEVGNIKKYGENSIYSDMAYSNQRPQVFSEMTMRENLLLWAKQPISDEAIKDVLKELKLDKFSNKLDEKVKNVSGGEQVRIGLARTLLKDPRIILLDEPTTGLDSQTGTEVRGLIMAIRKKRPGTTIVCVSHDEALSDLADRKINIFDIQNKK